MKRSFRYSELATVTSPSDSAVRTYYVWINLCDLPLDMPTKVNPREVNMHTTTAKKLMDAVSNADTSFDIHNRGMVLLANQVDIHEADRQIVIDFDDDENRYGVLDGGHTYEAIRRRRDQIPDGLDKFVKLEIFVGSDLDVAALSDARNTSVQVSDIALFNLENRFDFIKRDIAKQPYANDVAYKDNENKRIPIVDLLRLMYTFNIKRFPNDTSSPIAAYSGKASIFKDYRNEWEESGSGDEPSEDNIYLRLLPVLPKLVDLYETIEIEMVDKYKQYKSRKSAGAAFGKVRGIEKTQPGNNLTEFTQRQMPFNIASGYIMPIFGAFRALLKQKKDGSLDWVLCPLDMWETIGDKLVQTTFDMGKNPQSIGKSKTLWQSDYRIVENEMNRQLLKQYQNSKN